MLEKIFWLGHSTIRIDTEPVIYIDPWKVKKPKRAGLVLVSHCHYDHLSPQDVKKVSGPDTAILAPADCLGDLPAGAREMKPGDRVELGAIIVEAVPSYNTNKAFHPRTSGWVGFVITVEGHRIYYPGDTDVIPEMEGIKADIVVIPVGGTYTMTAAEAADAVNLIKPVVAIPIHWGDLVGTRADAEKFKEYSMVPVEIKPIVE
jgi:L-ascorbate metabolism protein UlaG (beta-lactamase superfamily)